MADTLRILIGCEARRVRDFPAYIIAADGRIFSEFGRDLRELRPSADAKGYLGLTICNGEGRRRKVRVHRLVAETFIPNPAHMPLVRHLDGNRQNNSADNLAWGTYAENEADKIGHGTWDTRRNGKLTACMREEAMRLLRSGLPQKDVAARMGVSRPTITRLANGTTWSGVQ
ncbi:HNH endonuclease [Cereibacter sphaeroides]|nr:HNH endonuclease [Cereibacter sphaeroides]